MALFKELCKVGKRESEWEFIKIYLVALGLAVDLKTQLFIPSLVSDENKVKTTPQLLANKQGIPPYKNDT